MPRDHRGEVCQPASFVGHHHIEPSDEGTVIFLTQVPGDVDPSLRRILKTLQSLAFDSMNRHPLSGSHDADDAVTGQRMAAAGVMHGHAGDKPPDGNGRFRPVLPPALVLPAALAETEPAPFTRGLLLPVRRHAGFSIE